MDGRPRRRGPPAPGGDRPGSSVGRRAPASEQVRGGQDPRVFPWTPDELNGQRHAAAVIPGGPRSGACQANVGGTGRAAVSRAGVASIGRNWPSNVWGSEWQGEGGRQAVPGPGTAALTGLPDPRPPPRGTPQPGPTPP